jgi:mono/diheme cytochrome c family protein
MTRFILAIACLLLAATPSLADGYGYGSHSELGQQNNVTVNVGRSGYSGGYWDYQPVRYQHCGRWYTSYRRVWIPAQQQQQQYAAQGQPVMPVGSINTDNSSTYNYSYTINYSQLPTAQGSTLYGQAFTETADIYGNLDLGVYYDQAIRVLADSGRLHDSAIQGTLSLLDQAGQNQTRVAETLARGEADARRFQALAELAKANAVPNSAHVSRQFSVQQGSGQTQVDGQTVPGIGRLQTVFNQYCVKCHGGVKTEGGLNLSDVSRLDEKTGENILDRITTSDPGKRMPRTADGKPLSLDPESFKIIFRLAR